MLALIGPLLAVAVICLLWGLYFLRQGRRRLAHLVTGPELMALPAQRPSPWQQLERKARQAGLPWQRQHVWLFGGLVLATTVLAARAAGPLTGLLVLVIGGLAPLQLLNWRLQRRNLLFRQQLPAALGLLASSLRAGGTPLQAIDALVEKGPEPLASEFVRAQRALRLQLPPHEALGRVAERVGVAEMQLLVTATKIVGDLGGNLAAVYEQMAHSIQERLNWQEHVRTQTTEGRSSALIVTLIPLFVLGLLQLTSPTYFAPLLVTGGGRLLLGFAALAMLIGWRWIRAITHVSL